MTVDRWPETTHRLCHQHHPSLRAHHAPHFYRQNVSGQSCRHRFRHRKMPQNVHRTNYESGQTILFGWHNTGTSGISGMRRRFFPAAFVGRVRPLLAAFAWPLLLPLALRPAADAAAGRGLDFAAPPVFGGDLVVTGVAMISSLWPIRPCYREA
jgi:hypothetical protein